MNRHEWAAVIVYEISEDSVVALAEAEKETRTPDTDRIVLDHENRRSIEVGCARCGVSYPRIKPGSECSVYAAVPSYRDLKPGEWVYVQRGSDEELRELRVVFVGPDGIRLEDPEQIAAASRFVWLTAGYIAEADVRFARSGKVTE